MHTNRQRLRRFTLYDANSISHLVLHLCFSAGEISTQEPYIHGVVKLFADTSELGTFRMVNDRIAEDAVPHLQLPHIFCFLVEESRRGFSDGVGFALSAILKGVCAGNHIHNNKTWVFFFQILLIQILQLKTGIVDVSCGITKFFFYLTAQTQITIPIVHLYCHALSIGYLHHHLYVACQIYFCFIACHFGETIK